MTDKWKKLEGRELKLKIENIFGIFLTPQGWIDQNKKAKKYRAREREREGGERERERGRERERERERACEKMLKHKIE